MCATFCDLAITFQRPLYTIPLYHGVEAGACPESVPFKGTARPPGKQGSVSMDGLKIQLEQQKKSKAILHLGKEWGKRTSIHLLHSITKFYFDFGFCGLIPNIKNSRAPGDWSPIFASFFSLLIGGKTRARNLGALKSLFKKQLNLPKEWRRVDISHSSEWREREREMELTWRLCFCLHSNHPFSRIFFSHTPQSQNSGSRWGGASIFFRRFFNNCMKN